MKLTTCALVLLFFLNLGMSPSREPSADAEEVPTKECVNKRTKNVTVRSIQSTERRELTSHIAFLERHYATAFFKKLTDQEIFLLFNKEDEPESSTQCVVLSVFRGNEKEAEKLEQLDQVQLFPRSDGLFLGKMNHRYRMKRNGDKITFIMYPDFIEKSPSYKELIDIGNILFDDCL